MSYNYNVYRNLSTQEVIQKFEPYTFPSFRQKSKVRNLKEPFFVVEATYNGEKVGLAVLELLHNQPHSLMKILSLWVKEEHRRRGIASQILRVAEKIALNNQINYLNIIFQNNWESFKWMPTLLQKLAWNKPEKRTILVKLAYKQVCDLPWFQIKDFPANFYVTKWVELTETELNYIKRKKVSENWYPDELSPFQLPDLLVAEGSFVLRYNEKIVGWIIIHKIGEQQVQVTSYFVDKDYRGTKASIALIVQAVEKIVKQNLSKEFIFMVSADNKEMLSLSKKIAGEHNTGAFTEVWVGQKWLQGQI
ncbi:GNAT family N-acetyltransferase [Raineya orbicola]|uniref:Acetyltransferase (GNAT) family n=1 Tax=Raineya orbicola TaxID=2016530 RepID=A0A2N3IIJ5_9BACT|nr:GNAT family N-acetyltransferase [Raineya orbicola]PKQ70134.1 Acetyltransferase (GNAT) family [Raineya orbicola]